VIYVVTTCANPSGKTMPIHRREALVKLARRYNALVVSDDVYDFLQWPSNPSDDPPPYDLPASMRLPRLSDIDFDLGIPASGPDSFGNAISNGSFSKIAGPGVRTGWVEGSRAFAKGLSQTGSTLSGGAPSQLCAAMMAEVIQSGELERFMAEVTRPTLRRRHRVMFDAIEKYITPNLDVALRSSGLKDDEIYGGYFLWFTLPHGMAAKELAHAALKEEDIVIGHGNLFEVSGDETTKFDSEVRLCFAWEPEEKMVDGIRRLGGLIQRMKDEKAYFETVMRAHDNEGVTHEYLYR
jgi:DNA-binding transcriptional MocR family regulator